MKYNLRSCVAVLGLAASSIAAPETSSAPTPALPDNIAPVASAMEAELARCSELKRPGKASPYFVGYWLFDVEHQHVEAELGALVNQRQGRQRFLRTELRVGSHELDNSHYFAMVALGSMRGFGAPVEPAPLDDEPDALRRALWLSTDNAYQAAIELLEQKRAERRSSVKHSAQAPDFSRQTPKSVSASDVKPLPAAQELARNVEFASRVFLDYPEVYESQVAADAWIVRRVFVSTEGVRSFAPSRWVRYSVYSSTQAADGMPLTRSVGRFGEPTAAELATLARQTADELQTNRRAELVEDYSGPILFEGEAAAQLAFELLGVTLSGTPSDNGDESPWLRRLGKRVMPKTLSVFDDPNLDSYRGLTLWGGYAMDDDGVPPERVELIENGRVRAFLMSRTPNEHFQDSNGHGRSGPGGWTRGSPGNLIVHSQQGLGQASLRRRLLAAIAEEGAEYGLIVRALERREAASGGMAPPRPEVIVKLYADGREQAVRGAELHDLTPRALKDIIATGNTPSVYDYTPTIAGAFPSAASVVAPSLLLEDVEVRRPSLSHELPPVLPRPQLNAE